MDLGAPSKFQVRGERRADSMLENMTAAGNVKLIYIWAGEVKMGKCIGGTSHITEKTPMG